MQFTAESAGGARAPRATAPATTNGPFAEALQAARKRAGLTQEQLAGLSLVSVRAIRDLEIGRVLRPRRETVRLLADALALSGSPRALLESAAGRPAGGSAVSQMHQEGVARPPVPMGPLLGRKPELAMINQALLSHHERLMCLVGLAGVGKTRLALGVAHGYRGEGPHQVLWISAQGEGRVPGSPGHATPRELLTNWALERLTTGPIDEFAELIGQRRTLLVLDDYGPSAADHAALLHLLGRCPGLQVLITTRTPLPFIGARTVPLAPLGISAATEMLLSHLRFSRPMLAHTPDTIESATLIARALDGHPLALELAAAWLPLYSPERMARTAGSAPLDLVQPLLPGEAEAPGASADLGRLLGSAVAELRPASARVLRALAQHDGPVPTDQLARGFEGPVAEIPRLLHMLLLRGLIREEPPTPRGAAVSALNLVRHTVRAASAVPAPSGLPRGPLLTAAAR
ncbi:helix-turn-helix domain-containing protein [Streptomyces sp. NPDC088923]|uniref:helix-turn-helix domain-containing protein n=1 Tax=Streptomyces sp. NPDC088923 TaxID=3365913 RepID=UPI00380F6697